MLNTAYHNRGIVVYIVLTQHYQPPLALVGTREGLILGIVTFLCDDRFRPSNARTWARDLWLSISNLPIASYLPHLQFLPAYLRAFKGAGPRDWS